MANAAGFPVPKRNPSWWSCNWLSRQFGTFITSSCGGWCCCWHRTADSKCDSLSLQITFTNIHQSFFQTCFVILLMEMRVFATDFLRTHILQDWCSSLTLQILGSCEYCWHNAALLPPQTRPVRVWCCWVACKQPQVNCIIAGCSA